MHIWAVPCWRKELRAVGKLNGSSTDGGNHMSYSLGTQRQVGKGCKRCLKRNRFCGHGIHADDRHPVKLVVEGSER